MPNGARVLRYPRLAATKVERGMEIDGNVIGHGPGTDKLDSQEPFV